MWQRDALSPTVLIVSFAFLFGFGAPAHGQAEGAATVGPEKDAAIRRLIVVTQAAELAVANLEAALPAQRAAMPNVPDIFWDEFAKRARADVPRFVDMLIPIYARHFTLAELRQLIAFYESPLGRRVVAEQTGITRESVAAGQRWGGQIGIEVGQELARRGVTIPR